MADSPQEYVWSLEAVHDLIEHDYVAGGEAAVEKLVEDVQAVADQITRDTEKGIERMHADADTRAVKLTAEAEDAVVLAAKRNRLPAS